MRAYVFPTDTAWARYLSDLQQRDPTATEVNFWLPGTRGFDALRPRQRFLFRSKASEGGRIIGGGLYEDYLRFPVSVAWQIYGTANGVASRDELLHRIQRYRARNGLPPEADPEIGCVLLTDVAFTPPGADLPLPPGYPMTATRGRAYSERDPEWSIIEQTFADLLWRAEVPARRPGSAALDFLPGPTRVLVEGARLERRGQRWFQSRIMSNYGRRCAITGSHIAPTLQAAHIRPLASEGPHRADNGLLLRSDVHTLFDAGYLGLDDRHRLQVSPRLRTDWGNGTEFYERSGHQIRLPAQRSERPDTEQTTWHMDTVFRR